MLIFQIMVSQIKFSIYFYFLIIFVLLMGFVNQLLFYVPLLILWIRELAGQVDSGANAVVRNIVILFVNFYFYSILIRLFYFKTTAAAHALELGYAIAVASTQAIFAAPQVDIFLMQDIVNAPAAILTAKTG